MNLRLSRRQADRRGLRLWPVGIALAAAFAIAVLVAAAVFYAGWDLLGARGLKSEPRLDSKTFFDLVKIAFGVVAGAGALVALVVAYRRQRVEEDGALRDATRLHTERFTTAVSQLDASPAVRLGGVHALAGLADDAPTRELRQTCIDVLCAYLRLPYTALTDLPRGDAAARHEYLALREVRRTVIRVIRDHLRLPREHHHSWQGHDLDLTGVVFDSGDFSRAVFCGGIVNFSGARFLHGTIDLRGAEFRGGTVDFSSATFDGCVVNFSSAKFSGGAVDFSRARFSNTGTVFFDRAVFSGGAVEFRSAVFGVNSWLGFRAAAFSGGLVTFIGAEFDGGTLDFDGAGFCGSAVHFSGAEFSGGAVGFHGATFSGGLVTFGAAAFDGCAVDFDGAGFSGGTVDFAAASGRPPGGLVPPPGDPLPAGLILAAAWQPAGP
ncbi:pentapeptide repeat-containing protein [Streptomyces sp. TRM 70351]|uniref:pentapeptide repeat-containing protein n=1 Tax=Streptomyces sp. TRM 70351 TaxID=3116552 RepID=UPI002E7B1FCB|nr:pentapeptide repeat-containing protein [Streptomyces sp. TRM 70351]MEE1931212.1 pentapeptide repeat-containing protein [Streptomyces sp. TRM 70351]